VSRADRSAVPAPPRLGRVLRLAAEDLYYHGVRLVPVNILWGVGLLIALSVLARSVLGFALIIGMVPLTIGLMGMATIVVRERTLVMTDFARWIRTDFVTRFALGVAQLGLMAIAIIDLLVGLQVAGAGGLFLVVVALYTLLAIWVLAVVAWPIVLDPVREGESLRTRLRLAAILVLAHPLRMGALGLVLAALLAISAVLAAAIITVSVAYAALVAAHFVLPAADRLEGRQTLDSG
jgi:uncharacterized membrane protein YesL